MLSRTVVQPSPSEQPEHSQQAGHRESHAHSPTKIQRQDEERSNSTADRRAAIEQRCGHTALVFGEPLRYCFCRTRPITRFRSPEKKSKSDKTAKTVR